MKTCSSHTSSRYRPWVSQPVGAGALRSWLCDRGSLTRRLQARCSRFSVEAVSQSWSRPAADEARLLEMPLYERAWLREVTLCCDGVPVVFAHSVLPRSSLRGEWRELEGLGTRPLGAALFANPAVVRTPLTYRKLAPKCALFQRAVAGLDKVPPGLWARRSVFLLHDAPILVTEVFLPAVLTL